MPELCFDRNEIAEFCLNRLTVPTQIFSVRRSRVGVSAAQDQERHRTSYPYIHCPVTSDCPKPFRLARCNHAHSLRCAIGSLLILMKCRRISNVPVYQELCCVKVERREMANLATPSQIVARLAKVISTQTIY